MRELTTTTPTEAAESELWRVSCRCAVGADFSEHEEVVNVEESEDPPIGDGNAMGGRVRHAFGISEFDGASTCPHFASPRRQHVLDPLGSP